MARFIDESFEGTGYEESWSETINGTATLDEDNSGPGTLPSGSGTQCLRAVIGAVGGEAYAARTTTARDTSYSRAYVYFSALSTVSGSGAQVLWAAGSGGNVLSAQAYHNGTNVVWRLGYHTGSWNYITGSTAINTGQWYRVEFCKTSGNSVELRVDGTSIGTGDATGMSASRGNPQTWYVGVQDGNISTTANAYIDLVAVDDTTWVGAESAPTVTKLKLLAHARRRNAA
jgi:hypothetical protein